MRRLGLRAFAPLCLIATVRHCATETTTTTSSSSIGGGGSALDLASRVNKLKRMHQQGQGGSKKELELAAWKELNMLSEQQIATAEGKAVALLLNSWAYFARFWEGGKDGPVHPAVASSADGNNNGNSTPKAQGVQQ